MGRPLPDAAALCGPLVAHPRTVRIVREDPLAPVPSAMGGCCRRPAAGPGSRQCTHLLRQHTSDGCPTHKQRPTGNHAEASMRKTRQGRCRPPRRSRLGTGAGLYRSVEAGWRSPQTTIPLTDPEASASTKLPDHSAQTRHRRCAAHWHGASSSRPATHLRPSVRGPAQQPDSREPSSSS